MIDKFVWILIKSEDYEDTHILGVFSSEKKGKQEQEKRAKQYLDSYFDKDEKPDKWGYRNKDDEPFHSIKIGETCFSLQRFRVK